MSPATSPEKRTSGLTRLAGLSAGALLADLVRASVERLSGGNVLMVGGVKVRLSESDDQL
jgi:hypothetical protein